MLIWIAGTALDLASKKWAFDGLGMPGEYAAGTESDSVYWLWKDVAGIQTSLNTGALFGMGTGWVHILALLSLLFQTAVIVYFALEARKSLWQTIVLGMISAGICGNLYDRLGWHGLTQEGGEPFYAVRDWILIMIGNYHWPNFNVADSLLVCSVILLLTQSFRSGQKESEAKNV